MLSVDLCVAQPVKSEATSIEITQVTKGYLWLVSVWPALVLVEADMVLGAECTYALKSPSAHRLIYTSDIRRRFWWLYPVLIVRNPHLGHELHPPCRIMGLGWCGFRDTWQRWRVSQARDFFRSRSQFLTV